MTTLLLIHGGLWEEVDADWFWRKPGIVSRLESQGFEVLTPDRPRRAADWADEVAHLTPMLPRQPAVVVGGSNGCTVAARLAVAAPDRVAGLLLAWPATRETTLDAQKHQRLLALGASPATATNLLAGDTMRGISDTALKTLTMPVGVMPSVPENRVHQRRTVDALLRLLPDAEELPGSPEAPSPAFPPHLDQFVDSVALFGRR